MKIIYFRLKKPHYGSFFYNINKRIIIIQNGKKIAKLKNKLKLMTAQEFYEQRRKLGLTDDITSNDSPDYEIPFYQSIFKLMEAFLQIKTKIMSENQSKEYVAQFTTNVQIGQYDWTIQHPSMKLTTDTKLAEIIEFFKKNETSKNALLDLRITELQ